MGVSTGGHSVPSLIGKRRVDTRRSARGRGKEGREKALERRVNTGRKKFGNFRQGRRERSWTRVNDRGKLMTAVSVPSFRIVTREGAAEQGYGNYGMHGSYERVLCCALAI